MNRTHDETSRALLAAAHRLLAGAGAEALTVRRIANEAGMSTMNVYSRFGGKDGVIDELFGDGYQRLIAEIDAVPTTDDVIADLLALAETYRRFAHANRTYYDIMFRSAVPGYRPSPEATQIALGALERFVSTIQRAQREDLIVARADLDARAVAAWLWASCHGMISLEIDGIASGHVSWATIFDNGIRTALAGLHPSVAPAPAV